MRLFWNEPSSALGLAAILASLVAVGRATAAVDEPAATASAIAEPRASDGREASASSVERGVLLRRERRDAEALEVFRQAYEQDPSPRLLAQVALAEQAVGAWVAAERDLVAALAQDDEWIESNRIYLEQSLATTREHLGTLVITSDAPGAELAVNGERLGPVSTEHRRIATGPALLVVQAPGYHPAVRSVVVVAGQTLQVGFTLVPQSPDRGHSMASTGRAADGPSVPSASQVRQTAKVDSSRTVAWVLVAAAGLFLTEGVVAHVASEHFASRYNDDALCVYGDLSRDQRCRAYREQVTVTRFLAAMGYGVAAASGIAAGTLFVRSRPRASSIHAASPTVGLSFGTIW
jgi:hypothetical protein